MSDLKKSLIIIVVALILGLSFQYGFSYLRNINNTDTNYDREQLKEFFYKQSYSEKDLREKYKNGELNVLIIPGHLDEEENFGTRYKEITEHELNLKIAEEIISQLSTDSNINIFTPFNLDENTQEKELKEEFKNYLEDEVSIQGFEKSHKGIAEFFKGKDLEDIEIDKDVYLSNTNPEVVKYLYAINKWSNENDVHIILNIHLNNYKGRHLDRKGKYEGFSIYVPDNGFSNSKASESLAQKVYQKLDEILEKSNSPAEEEGIIDNERLIALGAFNTLDAASILIEYGFIYEDKFVNPKLQDETIKNISEKTVEGLHEFLK